MTGTGLSPFGAVWFDALVTPGSERRDARPTSIRVGQISLGDESGTLLAVVPDPRARFPRARH